jgi:hypothetical protein
VRRGAELQGLQSDGKVLRLLSLLSAHKRDAGDALQVLSVVATPLAPAAASPGKPVAKSPTPLRQADLLVTLKGAAVDDDAVNELVAALRKSNRFVRVELKSIINGASAGHLGRQWSLECQL